MLGNRVGKLRIRETFEERRFFNTSITDKMSLILVIYFGVPPSYFPPSSQNKSSVNLSNTHPPTPCACQFLRSFEALDGF